MADFTDEPIELRAHLMRDGETLSVRYGCACGCKPQVKLGVGAPAAHEHCCCGIAHAAGPDAREHLEQYVSARKVAGEDPDRTYALTEIKLADPRGGSVSAAYAIPSTKNPH